MKEHFMKLKPEPFGMIKDGKKTIELRLYDEKRKTVAVGDIITFTNTASPDEILRAEVKELFVFDSFDTLYKSLPLCECGYTEDNIASASPRDMESYYSKEEQSRYGVVGIKISVLQNEG